MNEHRQASSILETIRRNLPGSDPSFDLEDCDKVLRVEKERSGIDESEIKKIVEGEGFEIASLL